MHARDCSRHATARFCADAARRRATARRAPPPPAVSRCRRPSRRRLRRPPLPSPPRRWRPPRRPPPARSSPGVVSVDTYYMYLLQPARRREHAGRHRRGWHRARSSTPTPTARRCALAAVTMNASMDPVAFQLDLGYGATGTIINAATASTIGPSTTHDAGRSGQLHRAAGVRHHHAAAAADPRLR